MSFLHFHSSSASSGNLRGESASSDATDDERDRAAASAAKMDPAATYAVPTFQPQTAGTEDFGRVYAAYGCWFIMLSLAWGWAVDGNRPDAGDGIGAGLAAVGAVVITFYPRS